jgi:hypothetical protein
MSNDNLSGAHSTLSPVKQALLEKLLRERLATRSGAGAAAGGDVASIRRGPPRRRVRASFSQENVWDLAQLEGRISSYNFSIHLNGALDVTALRRALNELVRRHEILRTSFVVERSKLFQIINSARPYQAPVADLTDLPEEKRDLEIQRQTSEMIHRPYNLQEDHLFRARVLRLGAEEYVLLFSVLHLIADHWSLRIIEREINLLYSAFLQGRPSPLAELQIQYADFAVWQRKRVKTLKSQVDYWTRQLKDYPPPLPLPTKQPRPPRQTFKGRFEVFTCPPALADSLRGVSQSESATMFVTILAAFVALVHRYTGRRDIPVSMGTAGRNPAVTEELIGCFSNTLILRVGFSGDPAFRELLRIVRPITINALENQDLPIRHVLGDLQLKRDPSLSALTQIGAILHHDNKAVAEPSGMNVTTKIIDAERTAVDLLLRMNISHGELTMSFQYNPDLFDADVIAHMRAHFLSLLRSVAEDPDQTLSQLSLLDQAEMESKP